MTSREQVLTLDATDEDLEEKADAKDAESEGGAEATESESDSRRRRWLRRPTRKTVALALGAVLLVGSLATTAVLAVDLHRERTVADAGQQALAAAQQYAVILTSVDAAKLDSNFAAVLDGATGEFKRMYGESSSQLKQVLIDNKAKADGKVVAAGIKSATADKVEVMLFLDQSVTNALNPEPRLDRNRIIMTMEKVDGRWLASDVVLP
ncbi:hypothetical protein BST36_20910 [Mycolicibacterium moriokaense]|jgi:Mce-associated membrane protein|uniref:Mce-associated membrane protein n=1 Tax=Mycolicibacterium moriokaense TaxID=39691 RepID=A0AAD1HAU1_9MYCO|nr:hypothetical protein [Mycolicibacterium moriokaense]MCV7039665.1 hypothetical protein [Mycolicibacterium moriokaense]ORB19886.1 hypothetical protein BST36_20910 [Mycolicibacterium moriokaense]BBX01887.1 hypothetical protein MMOR_28230 [Mycolicibacterium moriokaense]